EPQYSHGYLVVPFALVLLWTRRQSLPAPLPGRSAWGVALLALGTVLRLAGARFYFEGIEHVSLLPGLARLGLLLGGQPLVRWSWPALAFLLFMIPLPYRLEHALTGTLQRTATSSCAVTLQALGRPAVAEGNNLLVDGRQIQVVAACSGLGSLVVFFAMATGVALLSGRPMFDRVLLVLSAVPIALGANAVPITATVLLQEPSGDPASFEMWHDLAGWLMMALALAALGAELCLLRLLFVESAERGARSAEHIPDVAPRSALCAVPFAIAGLVVLLHGLL